MMRTKPRLWPIALGLLLIGAMPACSPPPSAINASASAPPSATPPADSAPADAAAPTTDAATRTAPVVPGRPGRVFIFAGVGDQCESLPDPQIEITRAPQKGDISLRPGQSTTIAASRSGKCLGATARGTGVYYTAHEGTAGTDTFVIVARMGSGETLTRTFSVTIAP